MEIHLNNWICQLLWCKWVKELYSQVGLSHLLHPQWIFWRKTIPWGTPHLPTIRIIKVEVQLFPLPISAIIRAAIQTCQSQVWRETSWTRRHWRVSSNKSLWPRQPSSRLPSSMAVRLKERIRNKHWKISLHSLTNRGLVVPFRNLHLKTIVRRRK